MPNVLDLYTAMELTHPVTWRYHVRAPWGLTQYELSADVPGAAGDLDLSMKVGLEVWRAGVAPATSMETELLMHDTVAWRMFPVAMPMGHLGVIGQSPHAAAPRERTPVLVMHSGHPDSFARRRLFLAGAPANWVGPASITLAGVEGLQTAARGLLGGLAGQVYPGPLYWLLAHPRAIEPVGGGPAQVGFRYVYHLRICDLVERAPQPTSEPWP